MGVCPCTGLLKLSQFGKWEEWTGVKAPFLRTSFPKEGDARESPWQKRGSIWGKLIFHGTTWKRNRNEPSSSFSLTYTFSVNHVYQRSLPSNASPHPQGTRASLHLLQSTARGGNLHWELLFMEQVCLSSSSQVAPTLFQAVCSGGAQLARCFPKEAKQRDFFFGLPGGSCTWV